MVNALLLLAFLTVSLRSPLEVSETTYLHDYAELSKHTDRKKNKKLFNYYIKLIEKTTKKRVELISPMDDVDINDFAWLEEL